jgi:pyruvate/2-oxoglutarate dehydrogenase complex dihydrolipoamide dehydrogenase (E3) component
MPEKVTMFWPAKHTITDEAMLEKDGYAKAILDKESEKILGFHIIGLHAPILIHKVVNAMTSGGRARINEGIHIHPSLSELIPVTLNSIEEVSRYVHKYA